MARHTTFRFCLDPTFEQSEVLARHAGASRFAFNQCLRIVKTALTERKADPDVRVPWSGFDLINAFNDWKKTEDAGRTFTVDADGGTEVTVTGLSWRVDVCQQVFEEAAVDLGHGLTAWSESRRGARKGKPVGLPRFKKKAATIASFRLRNKHANGRLPAIRIGDGDRPRSVTLPGIGQVALHDDTRRLRRMVAKGRARILSVTISYRGRRWWCAVTVEAAELHLARQHAPRLDGDASGRVGVDRGLSAFVVAATADDTEVARITDAPKALATGLKQQRRLSKSLSRKQRGSNHRKEAAARLSRHHRRVADIHRHFLHQVSNELVKTHDRLVIENLNVAGMLSNHRLARAISDAGWSEFAHQLTYKQAWRGGRLIEADRWYPSTRLCSHCGTANRAMTLADRVFTCPCGHTVDRDTNAAVNLALWGKVHQDESLYRSPDLQAGGRATNARRRDGTDQHLGVGETSSDDAGTDVLTAPAA